MQYAQPGGRLVASERKRHLLEVAGRIVAESGVGSLTMERLAAQAGVSKALPYRYFGSATKVMVALFEEERAWVDGEIALGLAHARSYESRVLAAVRPYFDGLTLRGPAFPVLMVERPAFEPLAGLYRQRIREIIEFWTRMGVTDLGIDRPTAHAAAGVILGAFDGAFRMLWRQNAQREDVDRVFTLAVKAVVRELRRASASPSRGGASERSGRGRVSARSPLKGRASQL